MNALSGQQFPELGCYGLAGHSATPRDLIGEARLAEELGIGSMFLRDLGTFELIA